MCLIILISTTMAEKLSESATRIQIKDRRVKELKLDIRGVYRIK